jgi:hypothetical protein
VLAVTGKLNLAWLQRSQMIVQNSIETFQADPIRILFLILPDFPTTPDAEDAKAAFRMLYFLFHSTLLSEKLCPLVHNLPALLASGRVIK